MKLTVNYNELSQTSEFFNSKNEEIKVTLDNIKRNIDRLSEAWEGKDKDIFVERANIIIDKEQEKRKEVEALGEMIKIVSKNYKSKDTEWEDKMKKEYINEYNNQGTRV